MSGLWFNFALLIFVQFLVFLLHAYYEKKLADVPRALWQGALIGVVIGPPLDLIFGQYLGLCTYLLGFGPLYLILQGALGWGLGMANTLLMQKARLPHFLLWTLIVSMVSEIFNLFFPLYTYPFPMLSIEYLSVALGSLLILAMAVALAWQLLFGYRFVFIDAILKRRR